MIQNEKQKRSQILITMEEVCLRHNLEVSFIQSLEQSGLIEVLSIEEGRFMNVAQLSLVEKYTRLHFDMDINVEGIETIVHLLDRVTGLQEENRKLQRKLTFYEPETSRHIAEVVFREF